MRSPLLCITTFAVVGLSTLFTALPARAGQFEAREVARTNNCTPKKIEVYQQTLGIQGRTTYRVDCTMAKKGESKDSGPDALLVACDGSLCELLRPIKSESK